MDKINRYYSQILQVTVFCLGGVLFWFAFIYYPKVVSDLRQGITLPARVVFKPVAASSYTFPIKTETYGVEFDQAANIYFVYISGASLPVYVFNADNAKLALKSALSIVDLCEVNVVYVSTEGLDVPGQYRGNADC